MTLQEMVREKNMTRYQLSQRSGIPWATLSDIWTGKTRLERCSGGTLVKLSGTLGITVEELIALDVETSMPPDDSKAEKPYFEVNLPQDLEKALREYIQGEQGHSRYLDCLWGELYGSINANQWGGVISKEQADYLRAKYLLTYGNAGGTLEKGTGRANQEYREPGAAEGPFANWSAGQYISCAPGRRYWSMSCRRPAAGCAAGKNPDSMERCSGRAGMLDQAGRIWAGDRPGRCGPAACL